MTPQSDVSLAPFCTMGVGGPARWFIEARSETEVLDALSWAEQRRQPTYILGGGSNVVIADEGLDGLVLRIAVGGIETWRTQDAVVYRIGAGEPWDNVVATAVGANAAGLECLSGIPGSTGGTPVQNVGAYGQDVSETIRCVSVIDRRSRERLDFANAQCEFTYRHSRFKTRDANRFIVTRVDFALTADGSPTLTYADVVRHFESAGNSAPTLTEAREAILAIRRRKGMVIESGNAANRSCGSFFVNPIVSRDHYARVRSVAAADVPGYDVDDGHVKIPAAWLIERAGFAKGTIRGAVGISPFQSQAIINLGGALANDVVALACEVKRAVLDTFGIALIPEPNFIGFSPSPSLRCLLDAYVNVSH